MPYVRSKADRGKALVLVVAVHALIALAVLSGPGQPALEQAVERLRTFDVRDEVPPPPPPEPAAEAAAPDEAAAPELKAEPSPLVVPPSPVRLPLPSPVATSKQAAPTAGSDRTAGASDLPGAGTGANGSGSGFGGGGSGGTGAGAGGLGAEARLLSGNLSRRDYRRIRSFGAPRGQAVLAITVGPEGRLTSCAPHASSGNPDLDQELCALLARTRWSPALDRRGEPVSVALRYVATWDRD